MGKTIRVSKRVIDTSSGELLKSQSFDVVQFDDERGYRYHKGEKNTRLTSNELPSGLTFADIGKLTVLSTNMTSNLLTYRSNKGKDPMGCDMIAKKLLVTERQAYRFLCKMIKKGIIQKATLEIRDEKKIHYYMNPIYFCNTQYISYNLYMLFKDDFDCILPFWVKQQFAEVGGRIGKTDKRASVS